MNEIIKKNGIQYGLIIGIISIFITLSIYLTDIELFTAWWIGIIKLVVYTIIAIVLLNKTKKELNNIFTFKEAFTTYFICFSIGIIIGTIFEILLFNFIDPSLKQTVQELSIETAVSMMKKFGAPSSEIKKAVEQMTLKNQFDSLELIKGSFFIILISSIFGLILAAIFKKDKPSF